MPVSTGKKIVDARPQAADAGVGSQPLCTSSLSSTKMTGQRSAGRMTASGVEGISTTDNTATQSDLSATSRSLSSLQHFKVPAVVVQRIRQQQHQHASATVVSVSKSLPASVDTASKSGLGASVNATVEYLPQHQDQHQLQHHCSSSSVTADSLAETQVSTKPHFFGQHPPVKRTAADKLEKTACTDASVEEEVSEADIAATVAALKTVSKHHLDVATTAKATQALHLLPSSTEDNSNVASAEPTTKSAATTPVATTKAKPVVFSHQWRRQLFANTGGTHLSLRFPRGEDKKNDGKKSISSADSSDTSREGECDDEGESASPFGNASVIKFSNTGGKSHPFGGPPTTARAQFDSSRSSSVYTDSESENEERLMLTDGDSVNDSNNTQSRNRRERRAAWQRAAEAREKKRVRRHMSGFDKDFIRQKEAQLLQEAAGEGDMSGDTGEEDDKIYGSEGGTYSNVEESLDEIGDEEDGSADDELGEEACEGESDTSSQRGCPSASSNAEKNGEGEGIQGAGATREMCSVCCSSCDNGGGFGAMNCARQKEAAERVAREMLRQKQNHDHHNSKVERFSPSLHPTALSSTSCIDARSQWFDSFFFAVHENRLRSGGCHHTLLGLRGPVSIHGPCGLVGLGLGEVCVNGFYLGKKQLNLWRETHHAVLIPMKKLKTKHAQDMELPQWKHVQDLLWPPVYAQQPTASLLNKGGREERGLLLGQPLNASHYTAVSPVPQFEDGVQRLTSSHKEDNSIANTVNENDESEVDFLSSLQWNCEAVFGEVDWDWVEAIVRSWRNLFSNKLPPILLVVQPSSLVARPRGVPGPMRKFYLSRKRSRNGRNNAKLSIKAKHNDNNTEDVSAGHTGAYMDIPSFVAHRRETSIDLALLPTIVPAVAGQGCGCVMVLGSANIGKSTLCRFLTNVLLSQHGLCYWLDLDLGQPEFGVPGQLTLVQVRRPLLRERDESCVCTVSAFFIGAITAVQCPVSMANALATICAQVVRVAQDHPVVVNTHGWVLQTGRRVTVEALRRLRPRQVIHLHKAKEEAWAQDTAALLDPRNGLNADVVQRRFLVRHNVSINTKEDSDSTGKGPKKQKSTSGSAPALAPTSLLCRLPFPHAFDIPSTGVFFHSESPVSSPTSPDSNTNNRVSKNQKNGKNAAKASREWRGQVHAVCVEREETFSSLQLLKATKSSKGRQQRWQTYFAPLLQFYEQRSADTEQKNKKKSVLEAETTLLEAPLSALRFIVLAERDEKSGDMPLFPQEPTTALTEARQTHAEVAAALEHAVVAVLFHKPVEDPSFSDSLSNGGCVVRSLASLPCGFPVTCYGVIESSEQELLTGKEATRYNSSGAAGGSAHGWICLRVPLRPAVVAAMLAESETAASSKKVSPTLKQSTAAAGLKLGATQISIAYSAALRQDTSFVDV